MAARDVNDGRALSAEILSLMRKNPDPSYVRANLSKSSKEKFAAMVQARRIAQALRIVKFLNSKGVDFVVLKGITLSCYDRSREFADMDILVAPEDVKGVGDMLAGEFGYYYTRPEELEMLARGDDNCHDVSLGHGQMLPIEVHFRLFNYVPDDPIQPLEGITFLDMDGVRIPSLCSELQVLEVLLHNALHHMFLCDKEKWARDMNLIIDNNEIDWPAFAKLSRRINYSEVAYLTAMFLRSHTKTKARIPDAAMRILRPESLACYLKKPVFAWTMYFCRDRLFPPPDILESRFHIKRSSPLFVFSYPANWARLSAAGASIAVRALLPRSGT